MIQNLGTVRGYTGRLLPREELCMAFGCSFNYSALKQWEKPLNNPPAKNGSRLPLDPGADIVIPTLLRFSHSSLHLRKIRGLNFETRKLGMLRSLCRSSCC